MLVSYFRSAPKYYYLLSLWGIILAGVIFYTYSRSAVIGLVMGLLAVGLVLSRTLWLKHRTALLADVERREKQATVQNRLTHTLR